MDTLTCILQEQAATATDELEQQAAQPPAEKPRLHQDLLSWDFPVEENDFLNCEHFSQVCMHSLQSPVLHQF